MIGQKNNKKDNSFPILILSILRHHLFVNLSLVLLPRQAMSFLISISRDKFFKSDKFRHKRYMGTLSLSVVSLISVCGGFGSFNRSYNVVGRSFFTATSEVTAGTAIQLLVSFLSPVTSRIENVFIVTAVAW